ncbi:uncharacterized protein LOC144745462 [Ciona intestinalis]
MGDLWKVGVLLVFAIASTEALRFPAGVKIAYQGGDCQSVQSLQSGRNYGYSYDGYIEHTDTNQNITGFRLRCVSVILNMLSSCSARMQLSGCLLHEGVSSKDIVLNTEDLSPRSRKLAYALQRFPVYFHFNAGEVLKIFLHKNEPADVANIKKGILSTLSLKYENNGIKYPLRQVLDVSISCLCYKS